VQKSCHISRDASSWGREPTLVWPLQPGGVEMARTRRPRRRRAAVVEDRRSLLLGRARRFARAGEYRKAAVALRQAAVLAGDAASWVKLGSMLVRARRQGEALQALKHGLWLHRRAGAAGRARTVARLMVELGSPDPDVARLAAA